MTESFVKPLKVEGLYPLDFENEKVVAEHLPRFIGSYDERRLSPALGYLSADRFEEENARAPVNEVA